MPRSTRRLSIALICIAGPLIIALSVSVHAAVTWNIHVPLVVGTAGWLCHSAITLHGGFHPNTNACEYPEACHMQFWGA